MAFRSFVRTAQGVATIARRRGLGYVGQLIGGVTWPKAAYRYGWGPSAPALLQGVFAAAGEFAASKTDLTELERLRLVTPGGERAVNVSPEDVERLMNRAHAAGITGVCYSFGSFVRSADGTVAFGDLSKARKHHPGSVHFLASRDADRRAFNRIFGRSVMTEASVRETRWPGPGSSMAARQAARPDSVSGSWDDFNRQVVAPLVAGKRVLDLGSNDRSLPPMLLKAGAREVVAVELTPAAGEEARISARILSWRDVRPYDVHVTNGDIRLFLTEDLGSFDVVTAFCCLHYLPDEEMGPVIRKAAAMDAVLILHANDAIDNLPAKTLDLHRLMRDSGYAEVQVHTPEGSIRPVLVGFTRVGVITPPRPGASLTVASRNL